MVGLDGLLAIQLGIHPQFLEVLGHKNIYGGLDGLQHGKVAIHKKRNREIFIDSGLSPSRVHQLLRPGNIPMDARIGCVDIV